MSQNCLSKRFSPKEALLRGAEDARRQFAHHGVSHGQTLPLLWLQEQREQRGQCTGTGGNLAQRLAVLRYATADL